MKPLVLDSTMTNMGGVFYPTGHVFALFPDEDCLREAASKLQNAGHEGGTSYASPDVILAEIVRTLGTADAPLPSVGAEGDMVRRIADLAGKGHHGLLIAMADKDTPERLVDAITPAGAVTAFYYRTFIIEDLIPQPADGAAQSVVVGTHAAEGGEHPTAASDQPGRKTP
ncbi:hypothetical protein [Paracidovorax sp. MALMAid1276]|uniref:hypothetical protein n=1 Tax=Paracidovorax sp. MALMAid1276 TaxID=3411631 RepID=UPI003B9C052F